MKLSTKHIIIFSLGIIFLGSFLITLITPGQHLFVYPSGSDYEIGKAMGWNIEKVIEIIIIIYAFVLLRKVYKQRKNK